ncbi:ester cyclase [Caballeronia sp. 15715]|uniref:ester cyclase n=1 Tax=Caballeronia sp. 15715 TaxID=3391030 RepID=UPI0039E5EA67
MKSLPFESEIDLDPMSLSARKNIVRIFYKEVWDKQDTALISSIFCEDFTFRGSLGPVLVGFEEFSQYVRWLTLTLDGYTSDILDLVEEGDRIVGKLRFHGLHNRMLFGHEPSNERVWWYGVPIFTFAGEKVQDLWVLGDIYGLVKRLETSDSDIEFALANATQ